MNMVRGQGVRQQCAEDEAAIRGFARDDLKYRGGADLNADVSGDVRGVTRLRAMKWNLPWPLSSKITLPSRSRIKISVAWNSFANQSRKIDKRSGYRVRDGKEGEGSEGG
jgi:hypothetical protein